MLYQLSYQASWKLVIVWIRNISVEDQLPVGYIQYCAKVMQTNFDEFPGFSGLFDENSLEMKFRRYFAAFSRHLLFQPREFSNESSLRVVFRREFSCDNSQGIFERNFIHCCPQVFEKSLPRLKYVRLLSAAFSSASMSINCSIELTWLLLSDAEF